MLISNISQWKTSLLGAIVMCSTLYYWFGHQIVMKKFEIITDINYWAISGGGIISILLFVAPDKIIDITTQFIKSKLGGVSEPTTTLPEIPNIDMPAKNRLSYMSPKKRLNKIKK